jgi:hypothetical protein
MNKKDSRIEILKRNGWTKQFIAGEPRISEAVEMYDQAGFEVHLEPLPPAEQLLEDLPGDGPDAGECRQCFLGFEDQYKIIFTRPKKGGSSQDDEFY